MRAADKDNKLTTLATTTTKPKKLAKSRKNSTALPGLNSPTKLI